LLEAALQWPDAVPDHPRAWLATVAGRRLIDLWRSDSARRAREARAAALEPVADYFGGPELSGSDLGWMHDGGPRAGGLGAGRAAPDTDDTLTLLFLCCHPALSPPSQLALTLRAVGGLTTAEIASAFLVPESTMGQRISRAKQTIRKAGARFEDPAPDQRQARLAVVLQVLYLIFNEGYAASSGPSLQRKDLTAEAIRLARLLHRLAPEEPEAAGLLALMLLTDARRPGRELPDGTLVPLAEQDRSLWNAPFIAEGTALLDATLGRGRPRPYQLQAAIAAVHDEASTAGDTDWAQIVALYTVLESLAPGPVVTLNRAVAVAMVKGPAEGLRLLDGLGDGLAETHRLDAVRAHLLELSGDTAAAREHYLAAARSTRSLPEQRYLLLRAAKLGHP
jgi:predicted RNA polymerase sigma factor